MAVLVVSYWVIYSWLRQELVYRSRVCGVSRVYKNDAFATVELGPDGL